MVEDTTALVLRVVKGKTKCLPAIIIIITDEIEERSQPCLYRARLQSGFNVNLRL